ncbi:hypothetical protein O181_115389 [Austropuccinia psidii MF-1]|uniref:Uncharacterized protein n=1 Tax=Austropuccinia psidii MF-1 TaxID=1389203 RepID=A0A9Q3PVK0_9BASI|nr:hypothetical protein [Austropuccinia psidii MF-1]
MVNIDKRLIMENKDITKQNLKKSKIEIRKSEQELSKELIQEPKEESDTYLPKKNNLLHIHTFNKDPIFLQYHQHFRAFNPSRELNKEIQPENESIKKVLTVEKGSEITENEVPFNPKPQDFTNIRSLIEPYFMEKKPQPNDMCSSNSTNQETNEKEEDSPTPHYHSDKYNVNLNLEANYFSLDKAKESQMNKNEEINEEISNNQQKQDQEYLLKQTNIEELEADGILLTEDQFPWEGYTNCQPLRNENCNLELYKITEQDYQCSFQHVKWLKGIKKEPNFWITQNKKICPNLQAHLASNIKFQHKIRTGKKIITEMKRQILSIWGIQKNCKINISVKKEEMNLQPRRPNSRIILTTKSHTLNEFL